MMPDKVSISVVIPVYNSQNCLSKLVRRLNEILKGLGKSYEIILVNDGSQDASWEKIVELSRVYHELEGINLRRNFGQDNAIMAGLNHSSGESIIIMDDDLQHEPGDIPALLQKLNEGYDVCYAKFKVKRQLWFKNLGSWFNGKAASIILNKPREIYLSPYKAIRRQVVDEMIKYDGPFPYADGLLFRTTGNITQIPVEHHPRFMGKSNYTLRRSINVWLKLATNFSVVPLRAATLLGFTSSGVGFILATVFFIRKLTEKSAPPGWASLIVIVLFLGGIQLVSLGIIGEYVGRLFLHHNKNPQFIIRAKTGLKDTAK